MLQSLTRQAGSIFFLLLKLFKIFKSVKLLLAGATFATYSYLLTWEFALGIMWTIGIHEMGHVWAMRKTGMPTPGFYFIPLFGGAAIGERSQHEWQDVYITAMGPTFGILSALPPAVLYFVTGETVWAALIGFIGLVNLFNLLPIYPLDGGRMSRSLLVSSIPSAQILFLLLTGGLVFALAYYMNIYFVAILFGLGIFEVYMESRQIDEGKLEQKPPLNRDGIILTGACYLSLIAIFLFMIYIVKDIEGADLALRILRDV
ncbi:MAG: site-2 protease family protein [Pseudomonadota bacterium]